MPLPTTRTRSAIAGNVAAWAATVHRHAAGRAVERIGQRPVDDIVDRRHAHQVGDRHVEVRGEVDRQPVERQVDDDVELVLVAADEVPHGHEHGVGRHLDRRVAPGVLAARLERAGDLVRPPPDEQRARRGDHLDVVPEPGEPEDEAVQRQLDPAPDPATRGARPASTRAGSAGPSAAHPCRSPPAPRTAGAPGDAVRRTRHQRNADQPASRPRRAADTVAAPVVTLAWCSECVRPSPPARARHPRRALTLVAAGVGRDHPHRRGRVAADPARSDVLKQTTATAVAAGWPAPGSPQVNGQRLVYGFDQNQVAANRAAINDASPRSRRCRSSPTRRT